MIRKCLDGECDGRRHALLDCTIPVIMINNGHFHPGFMSALSSSFLIKLISAAGMKWSLIGCTAPAIIIILITTSRPWLEPSHLTIFLLHTSMNPGSPTYHQRLRASSLKFYGMNDLNCWFKLYNTVTGQESYLDNSNLNIAYTWFKS